MTIKNKNRIKLIVFLIIVCTAAYLVLESKSKNISLANTKKYSDNGLTFNYYETATVDAISNPGGGTQYRVTGVGAGESIYYMELSQFKGERAYCGSATIEMVTINKKQFSHCGETYFYTKNSKIAVIFTQSVDSKAYGRPYLYIVTRTVEIE